MASDHDKVSKTRGSREFEKKPYVKPAFRHEQVFETMALACGKISATQMSCRTNRKNS
jgi:hypothetical protein